MGRRVGAAFSDRNPDPRCQKLPVARHETAECSHQTEQHERPVDDPCPVRAVGKPCNREPGSCVERCKCELAELESSNPQRISKKIGGTDIEAKALFLLLVEGILTRLSSLVV